MFKRKISIKLPQLITSFLASLYIFFVIGKRFVTKWYDDLEEEARIAIAISAHHDIRIYEHPTLAQKRALLVDRLLAVSKLRQADLRGRWHGLIDRASDIIVIWTALKCALIYRECIVSGVGVVPYCNSASPKPPVFERCVIDGGITKCTLAILGSREIRTSTLDYVLLTATARYRSGMRSKNEPPCGVSMRNMPWRGQAGLSVAHAASRAMGDITREIHETLTSLATGMFKMSPDEYYVEENQDAVSRDEGAAFWFEGSAADSAIPTKGPFKFCQPGIALIDYVSRRLRSQLPQCLGVNAFASLLHPEKQLADRRYKQLKKRCAKLKSIVSDEQQMNGVPGDILQDIKKLCRDDLFMQVSELFSRTMSLGCCRLAYDSPMYEAHFGTADDSERDENEDEESNIRMNRNCEAPLNDETQPMEPLPPNTDNKLDRPIYRQCPQTCSCNGASSELCGLLEAQYAGAFGTKWTIEHAFNSVRRLKESCAVTSRGAAELSMYTKHACIHANSIHQAKYQRCLPIVLTDADWELSTLKISTSARDSNAIFRTSSGSETSKAYSYLVDLLGMRKQMKRRNGPDYSFTATLPHKALAVASAEILLTAVPQPRWKYAWVNKLIPSGTIIFNPTHFQYRAVLESGGAHLMLTWPAKLCVEPSLTGELVSFELSMDAPTVPENLFIFADILPSAMEAGNMDQYTWYAVRTDVCERDESGSIQAGGPLTVAVPRVFTDAKKDEPQSSDYPSQRDDANEDECAGAEMVDFMQTVPLISWAAECGLVNTNKSERLAVLVNLELDALRKSGDTVETEHAAISRIKKSAPKDDKKMFDRILELACPNFGEEDKKKAHER